MATHKQFDTERFDLMRTDKVHIADYTFGHNEQGELDVWVERCGSGETFARQITFRGAVNAVTRGVYTRECRFLRERASGRYFFLDRDARGFYLQSESFFGAETFLGAEAVKVSQWLAARAQHAGVL